MQVRLVNTLCWRRRIYRLVDLFFWLAFLQQLISIFQASLKGSPYGNVTLFSDSLELASATYEGGKAMLLQVAGVCMVNIYMWVMHT